MNINKDILENKLIKLLLTLNLPKDDFAIMAGGCMLAHGLKEFIHDLDVIARGEAWQKVIKLGIPVSPESGDGKVVYLFDGRLEIFNRWNPGDFNIDELIDTAEVISGIRFVKLEIVKEWLIIYNREKDKEKIKKIEEYLKGK